MGDLRDQLMKAGLVSPEQAKKAEEAEARPPQGPPRPPKKDRPPGAGQGGAPAAPRTYDANLSARDLAQAGRLDGKTRGGRRWYYLSRRGAVPYLELNDDACARLESGAAAIAESPSGEAWLVDGEAARRLAADDKGGGRDWVRLYNRS